MAECDPYELYHKLIYELEGEQTIGVIPVSQCPRLIDVIDALVSGKEMDKLIFAGTCLGDELEWFGPDVVEFELDEQGFLN